MPREARPRPPRRVRRRAWRRSRGTQGLDYDLIHAHYWLSGVAGLALRERWGAPARPDVPHPRAASRTRWRETPAELEPELRIAEETRIVADADRIVAANVVERAHLVWYYGARSRARRGDPVRRGHRAVPADGPGHGQGPARAAARAAAALRGAAPADQGARDAAGGHGRGSPSRARLLIVGGEHDEPRQRATARALRAQVAALGLGARVRFLGAQPQRRLRLFYAAADATVMPSYYESFGMVALEAMACGSPVVASRVGGLTTTVQDGVTGHLVPEGDPAALADRHHPLARQTRRRAAARPAGHALGRRAPLAVRGGGGLPPLLRAAPRGPAASPSRPLQELAMTTPGGAPITVNGRRYAWPDRPLVVVCVDGCEPDYIRRAIAAGAMPYLAAALPGGTDRLADVRGAELHESEQSLHRDRRAARRCTASAATTSSTATPARRS